MANIGPGVAALRGTAPGDVTTTVQSANRLLRTLAMSDAQLGDLVGQSDTTLGVTAARQGDIAATLQQGPQTLSDTQATMTSLNGLFDRLDPVADALRPGARELYPASTSLEPALRELRPVLHDARPTLAALRPALANLAGAARSGVPLLNLLIPTLNRLNATIIPALNAPNATTHIKLYEAIGPTAATVSDSASLFDANGYTQRFQAVAGGANSPSFLPCSLNLTAYKLTCSDLQAVLGPLLGAARNAVHPDSRVKGAH
jgi:ABC-type transporter Mla subunit MlaD